MIVGILFCVLILGWLGRITLWLSTTLALFVYWRRTKWRKNRSLVEVVEAVVRNFSCLVSLVKCDEKEHMFLIHHTFVQSIRKFFPLPATMQEAFPGSPPSNNTRAYYSRELNLEEEVYLPWNLACDIFGNYLHCKIGVKYTAYRKWMQWVCAYFKIDKEKFRKGFLGKCLNFDIYLYSTNKLPSTDKIVGILDLFKVNWYFSLASRNVLNSFGLWRLLLF